MSFVYQTLCHKLLDFIGHAIEFKTTGYRGLVYSLGLGDPLLRPASDFDLYLQCHTQQEIAEKLGWDHTTIYKDIENLKNGKSAENQVPDPLRFAEFTKNGGNTENGKPDVFQV